MTLADSIIYSDIETIQQQLNHIDDLDMIDEYGFTPLIQAAVMNRADVAELLLEHGADPNFTDTTQRTALMWACDNNNYPFCDTLMKKGADPNQYAQTGQSSLVLPLLRQQNRLKELLINHGASIDFALGFIYAKLIGHRFELTGKTHITAPNNALVLVDFEGFMLEFTLLTIVRSLQQYQLNYASRSMSHYFNSLKTIIQCFVNGSQLVRLQHYQTDRQQHQNKIDKILSHAPLLLPVVYEGHAISFVQVGNYLAKCDRGAHSKIEGTVNIYQILDSRQATQSLWEYMLYEKNTDVFFHQTLHQILKLRPIIKLPISPQVTGNCSWANAEAAIPTLFFLLDLADHKHIEHSRSIKRSFDFFYAWQHWDQSRALYEYINRYDKADDIGKASIVSILAAIFFKLVQINHPQHQKLVKQILPILKKSRHSYVMDCYRRQFHQKHRTPEGEKLEKLLNNI